MTWNWLTSGSASPLLLLPLGRLVGCFLARRQCGCPGESIRCPSHGQRRWGRVRRVVGNVRICWRFFLTRPSSMLHRRVVFGFCVFAFFGSLTKQPCARGTSAEACCDEDLSALGKRLASCSIFDHKFVSSLRDGDVGDSTILDSPTWTNLAQSHTYHDVKIF